MTALWRLPATEIADGVRTRRFSALDVTEATLERLATANGAINAVVAEMPEEARAAAKAVDAAVAQGIELGPLAGVPVTIKVNVDQKGHATTNGLRIQKDLVAAEDSPVVSNLRKAGAVIVGRTNTPAFSLRWFCRNSLHGWTKNPRDPSLTPGGSSGGAASATAAGIGAIGHGTDIAGSIRYPAYACGIHGLRPSLGRVAAANLSGADRPIGPQLMAVSGPLARTVGDLRIGLEAMAAPDWRDPWALPVPLGLTAPKTVALDLSPAGMKVDPAIADALRRAAAALEAAGWTVEEVSAPSLEQAVEHNLTLWTAEYQMADGAVMKAEDDPDALFVYEHLTSFSKAPTIESVMTALQQRITMAREWRSFFAKHSVVLCPVSGELPFRDQSDVESPEDFARIVSAQTIQIGSPFIGLPGLTVSTGLVGTAPVGVQLLAAPYQEETLLRAGEVIEAAGTPPSPVDPA